MALGEVAIGVSCVDHLPGSILARGILEEVEQSIECAGTAAGMVSVRALPRGSFEEIERTLDWFAIGRSCSDSLRDAVWISMVRCGGI